MTLFAFRGVKSHGWPFYDNIKPKQVENSELAIRRTKWK